MNYNEFILAKEVIEGYIVKVESKKHSLDEVLQEMKHDVAFLNGQIAINKFNRHKDNSHTHE